MKEILLINPTRKKARRPRKSKRRAVKAAPKKEVTTMAKRRRRRAKKNGPVRSYSKWAKVYTHKRRTHNPSRARRAGRAIGRTIMGMNIKAAMGNVPPAVIGMMAAKWASKLFAEGSATETDPSTWTWSSYLKGSAGAFLAGFLAQNLKGGWGQKVLEGGMNLMAYKLIQNELIPKSEWAQRWFGQDEAAQIQYNEEGTPFLLGQDGNWYPADERHRLPEANMMGDALEVPGRLGDALEVPGRLGGAWEDAYFGQNANDPYAKAFLG